MAQNGKELIEYIAINDYIKEVDLSYLKGGDKQIFIICQDSFKYKNVDIHKFVQRRYTKDQVQSIVKNGVKFNFICDEILSMNENKKDFYIVDNSFLSKFGITNISSNIFYYVDNSKKFLYFLNEFKLLMIESGNRLSLTPNINNNKIYHEVLNTNEYNQNNNNNIITNYDHNSVGDMNNNTFFSVKK